MSTYEEDCGEGEEVGKCFCVKGAMLRRTYAALLMQVFPRKSTFAKNARSATVPGLGLVAIRP